MQETGRGYGLSTTVSLGSNPSGGRGRQRGCPILVTTAQLGTSHHSPCWIQAEESCKLTPQLSCLLRCLTGADKMKSGETSISHTADKFLLHTRTLELTAEITLLKSGGGHTQPPNSDGIQHFSTTHPHILIKSQCMAYQQKWGGR